MRQTYKRRTEICQGTPPIPDKDSALSEGKHEGKLKLSFPILILTIFCSVHALEEALTGWVADQTGAIVPMVSITMHNVATNVATNKDDGYGRLDRSVPEARTV